jgi:GAF domain-containing protein
MGRDFDIDVAAAAREMAEEASVLATLERAVRMCVETVPHCDLAGICVAEHGRVETLAASTPELKLIDELQFELGEGPCVDSLRQDETVTANDLATDPRWPRWGTMVSEQVGVRASLSYRLFTSREVLGALTLYSREAGAFDHDNLAEGYVLAAHAAVALTSSVKEAQLTHALERRTVIGQATGMLMERFGLDADAAFGVLRRLSQTQNIKVVDLAAELVQRRRLPETDRKPKGRERRPR